MNNEIINQAKENLKAEFSVIPTKEDKAPALSSWKPYQSQRIKAEEIEALFSGTNVKGLGIVCGAISGNLEVIDVDTKHDATGSLWEELRTLIEDNLPDLYKRLVISQTRSGGYHIYYRCSSIAGNLKLATKKNKEVLIETRGEGGYVVAAPSPGYTYIQSQPGDTPTITLEEREILLSIARSFNELEELKPTATAPGTYNSLGLSPFEDYNQRGDILELLQAKGWKVINQRGQRVNLLRPGSTDSKTSGNFHTDLRILRVFSSSTEFNPDKAYSASQVFSLLECNGDNKLTYKKLLELGYGEPYRNENIKPTQVKTEAIKVEVVNKVNRETSVISKPGEALKIEALEAALGDDVFITAPGSEATAEVLSAIELIQATRKRIYIVENGEELREYKYQLQAIFNKYGEIEEQSGGLKDRDIHSLLDEIVIISTKLQPVDKDLFLREFLKVEAIQELGIGVEALQVTVDKLTTTRDKEAQAVEFKKLLSKATELQDKGEVAEALELLNKGVKDIDVKTGLGLLPPPLSFSTIIEEIATLPPAYKTGYSSLDSFVGFTPGAITLIAGRPSHGKTTVMFNLLLEMSKVYTKESFYFFTYEEPLKNISVKLLNCLVGADLTGHYSSVKGLSTPTNYEFLKMYIKEQRTDIVEIEEGKEQLAELIDSQRIKIIDRNYSVEELSSLMSYLKQREPIGGVFIDYIQRMRTEVKTQDMRTKIAHISDSVLQIAKNNTLPIILGAQLNRTTNIGRPTLENLKEAGNLEEDANTVLSVYNESREKDETPEGETYKGKREVELEIKALKNREGEVNQSAKLIFDKWTGKVKNIDQQKQPEKKLYR